MEEHDEGHFRGPVGQRWPPRSRVQGLHKCCHQRANPNTAFLSNLVLLHGFQTDVVTLFVIRLDQHCSIRLGVEGTQFPHTATSPDPAGKGIGLGGARFRRLFPAGSPVLLGDGEVCERVRPRRLFAVVDFTLASTSFRALEHLTESQTDKP